MHDLTDPEVRAHYLRRIRSGCYDVVWLAPPCSSFSTLLEKSLRPLGAPMGSEEALAAWPHYMERHNAFVTFAADAARAAEEAKAVWAIENPASQAQSGHAWPAFADRATIWDTPIFLELIKATLSHLITFSQCMFDGDFRKDTTLLCSASLLPYMTAFTDAMCSHSNSSHRKVAAGLDAQGRPLPEQAAAYPPLMNDAAAAALCAAAAARSPKGQAKRD